MRASTWRYVWTRGRVSQATKCQQDRGGDLLSQLCNAVSSTRSDQLRCSVSSTRASKGTGTATESPAATRRPRERALRCARARQQDPPGIPARSFQAAAKCNATPLRSYFLLVSLHTCTPPIQASRRTVLERERPALVVPLFTEASQNTCPSTSLNAAAVSMPGHGTASPRHVSNCTVLHLPHCRSRRGEAGGSARLSNELPSPTTPAPHPRQLTSRPRS